MITALLLLPSVDSDNRELHRPAVLQAAASKPNLRVMDEAQFWEAVRQGSLRKDTA